MLNTLRKLCVHVMYVRSVRVSKYVVTTYIHVCNYVDVTLLSVDVVTHVVRQLKLRSLSYAT